MPTPIGIDLGTTFSVIACYKDERVEIISESYDRGLIQSMVYYDPKTGEVSVGRMAYEKSIMCPSNFIKDAKRIIGRKFDDETTKQIFDSSNSSLQLTQSENGMAAYEVEIDGQPVLKKPEEVSAEILKHLVKFASKYLDEEIKEAVISVPAYFSGAQRKSTLKAAELAGLKVMRLISEPVAGALHYVTDKQVKEKILVFDFGGGTLDVSLIEVNEQVFEVKAVSGDTTVGGRNIDNNIFEHFYVPPGKNLNLNKVLRSLRRLEQSCRILKEFLSTTTAHTKIIDNYNGDDDLILTMDRKEFNEINESIFRRTLDIVKYCLRSANCEKEEIQRVVLVGGSSRIPRIQELLKDLFGSSKIHTDLNPDEAVARGACLQAAILSKEFRCFEKYYIREVNPLSLGILGYGDLTYIVIPRNSKLPTTKRKRMVTTKNDQKSVPFTIIEGEWKNSEFNNKLGTFTVDNLPPKQAGSVSFTVDFTLDEDGILSVKATENSTNKSNNLTVTMGEFRLSEHEINYNIEQSEKFKEQDDLFEKFILRRNEFISKCNEWEYNSDNKWVCQNCKNFISDAEKVGVDEMEDLETKFAQLEKEMHHLLPTLDST